MPRRKWRRQLLCAVLDKSKLQLPNPVRHPSKLFQSSAGPRCSTAGGVEMKIRTQGRRDTITQWSSYWNILKESIWIWMPFFWSFSIHHNPMWPFKVGTTSGNLVAHNCHVKFPLIRSLAGMPRSTTTSAKGVRPKPLLVRRKTQSRQRRNQRFRKARLSRSLLGVRVLTSEGCKKARTIFSWNTVWPGHAVRGIFCAPLMSQIVLSVALSTCKRKCAVRSKQCVLCWHVRFKSKMDPQGFAQNGLELKLSANLDGHQFAVFTAMSIFGSDRSAQKNHLHHCFGGWEYGHVPKFQILKVIPNLILYLFPW